MSFIDKDRWIDGENVRWIGERKNKYFKDKDERREERKASRHAYEEVVGQVRR